MEIRDIPINEYELIQDIFQEDYLIPLSSAEKSVLNQSIREGLRKGLDSGSGLLSFVKSVNSCANSIFFQEMSSLKRLSDT